MIKSAIEQQKYNEPSKANILKVYDEIEKNQQKLVSLKKQTSQVESIVNSK